MNVYKCRSMHVQRGLYRPNYNQGRRPGGLGGRSPKTNLRWGTAHALVPPIFREVVLSDARERMNMDRVKKWSHEGILF